MENNITDSIFNPSTPDLQLAASEEAAHNEAASEEAAYDDAAYEEAAYDDAAYDEAQARYYDENMVLNDLEIEEGLIRQLPWYRYG